MKEKIMQAQLSPQDFVTNWRGTSLKERSSYQAHFMDVCYLIGYETPTGSGVDHRQKVFEFERGVKKDSGAQGFADVYLEGRFAVEYKAPDRYKTLDEAYQQLLKYRIRLKNPPLLVVTDINNWEIHTNFPNTEEKIYKFTHEEILDPANQRILRLIFENPRELHPDRSAEDITKEAAASFKDIVDNMRDAEASPEQIAHFLTKLTFCLFAEDIALLPSMENGRGIFTHIVETTQTDGEKFRRYINQLFQTMNVGGDMLMHDIHYFNGTLFDNADIIGLGGIARAKLYDASRLNWEFVQPTIFGTLFERAIDSKKRSQLGAHYTSRDDIMLIVEPVLLRPLEREWESFKIEADKVREIYDKAKTGKAKNDAKNALIDIRLKMLEQVRNITVLDPACGSGNFLYVALQALLDFEQDVLTYDAWETLREIPSLQPEVHPKQMYGIEVNPIAHALASIVVWIGYLQWKIHNGYRALEQPILQDIQNNIVCKDAILAYESLPLRSGGRFRGGNKQGKLAHTRISQEIWTKLKPFARSMRQEPTPAEGVLWQRLRKKQLLDYKFRRQHPVGHFIVDFYCADAHLVIEVDGSIHEQQEEYDELRQAYIESLGLRVIRFQNEHVLQNIDGVLERIGEVLSPPPNPLPASQRGGTPTEPTWPTVDVIIGNPPFLGGKKIRRELGSEYVDTLYTAYPIMHGEADLVTYWFEKAHKQLKEKKVRRVGLLATSSIRGINSRAVLERIKETDNIFMAHADREWVLDGAAVRVSMVGFDDGNEDEITLDGINVDNINADLTSKIDTTIASRLEENFEINFMGITPTGKFVLDGVEARNMIDKVSKNHDVLFPYLNAMDITRHSRDAYIVNFTNMSLEEAKEYVLPMQYILESVKPFRDAHKTTKLRENWWLFEADRSGLRKELINIKRYIATPRVAKHRVFIWINKPTLPDGRLYAFTRDDDYFFGMLHSKIHEIWSLAQASWHGKGNDPTYNNTTCFETFPFPWSPNAEEKENRAYQAISAAAKQLHEERDAWLKTKSNQKDRTLTNLYNALQVFRGKDKMKIKAVAGDFAPRLDELHNALDKAVCDAYGWPHSILEDEEEILGRLLALNLERANA